VLATKTKMGIDKEKKAAHEMGAPVVFHAQGAKSEQENQMNIVVARQSPGYLTCKEIVADAIDRRGERIMLDFTAEQAYVRYFIDGVWHDVGQRDRESGDVALAVMKKMANLNERERRAKQEGKFKAEYKDKKYDVKFLSQGVKTGERVMLHVIDPKAPKLKTLEELGMREKMQAQLKEVLAAEKGMVLFSSPPAGGLSTSFRVAIGSTDRVLRDFQGLEEKSRREVEIENVDMMTFDSSAGETPVPFLDRVVRKQPDAMVVPELFDAESVAFLCQQANDNKVVRRRWRRSCECWR
jgi:type II secretory ATPase GspE/PulE/Tfp pilus assembly ATPase PilB-like protein